MMMKMKFSKYLRKVLSQGMLVALLAGSVQGKTGIKNVAKYFTSVDDLRKASGCNNVGLCGNGRGAWTSYLPRNEDGVLQPNAKKFNLGISEVHCAVDLILGPVCDETDKGVNKREWQDAKDLADFTTKYIKNLRGNPQDKDKKQWTERKLLSLSELTKLSKLFFKTLNEKGITTSYTKYEASAQNIVGSLNTCKSTVTILEEKIRELNDKVNAWDKIPGAGLRKKVDAQQRCLEAIGCEWFQVYDEHFLFYEEDERREWAEKVKHRKHQLNEQRKNTLEKTLQNKVTDGWQEGYLLKARDDWGRELEGLKRKMKIYNDRWRKGTKVVSVSPRTIHKTVMQTKFSVRKGDELEVIEDHLTTYIRSGGREHQVRAVRLRHLKTGKIGMFKRSLFKLENLVQSALVGDPVRRRLASEEENSDSLQQMLTCCLCMVIVMIILNVFLLVLLLRSKQSTEPYQKTSCCGLTNSRDSRIPTRRPSAALVN